MRALSATPESYTQMVNDLPPDSPAAITPKPSSTSFYLTAKDVKFAITGIETKEMDPGLIEGLKADLTALVPQAQPEDLEEEDEDYEDEEEDDPAAYCGECEDEFDSVYTDKCPCKPTHCKSCCGCYYCESCEVHLGVGASDVPGACASCFYCPDCKDCDCDPVPEPEPVGTTFAAWKASGIKLGPGDAKNVCEGPCETYVPSPYSGNVLVQGFCYQCFHCEDCGHDSHCLAEEYIYKKPKPKLGSGFGGRTEWGSFSTPLWEQRGVTLERFSVDETSYLETWDIEAATDTDICLEMASFYLAEGVESKAFNRPPETSWLLDEVARQARDYRQRQVARLDPLFQRYCDMAIGGELRHHRSCRQADALLRGERYEAWGRWKVLRERNGAELLQDAAAMFRDIERDGYGGEKWAVGCDLLYQRQMGQIPPAVWVDRVFTLQHNGGSFLNKIGWAMKNRMSWHLDYACKAVGPAHAHRDTKFPILLAVADEPVVSLFREYWREANRIKVRWRHPAQKVPSVGDGWWKEPRDDRFYFGWDREHCFPSPREMHPMWLFSDEPQTDNTRYRRNRISGSMTTAKLAVEYKPLVYVPKEGTPDEVQDLVPEEYKKKPLFTYDPAKAWYDSKPLLAKPLPASWKLEIDPYGQPHIVDLDPEPGPKPLLSYLMDKDPVDMTKEEITAFGQLTKDLNNGKTCDGSVITEGVTGWDGASFYPTTPYCVCSFCVQMVMAKQKWIKENLSTGDSDGTM